jgi:FkbM family methyltransferase
MAQTIEQLCAGEGREALSDFPYWECEVYGFGKWIRRYGYYPSWLPLYINTDHAPSQADQPNPAHLQTTAYCQFYHSPRLVEQWTGSKPCYTLHSPFVFCRKQKGIELRADRKGTIVFPAHSTHHVAVEKDWHGYIRQLLALPEQYQPIAACIYYLDVQKGLHKIFESYGIPVFSAGHWLDPQFAERFYQIISQYRYASSDLLGSYVFYCTEMGLPFFLYPTETDLKLVNNGDPNIPLGEYKFENNQVRKSKVLFGKPVDEVTEEQMAFVRYELGLTQATSRYKMALILYRALLHHIRHHKRETMLAVWHWLLRKTPARLKTFVKTVIRRLVPNGLVHRYRMWRYPDYKEDYMRQAEIERLQSINRYTAEQTRLVAGRTISFPDAASFLFIYNEIFVKQIYEFQADTENPYIIDAGANIGMSTIYFKQLYPHAEIVAFEPDQSIAKYLYQNIASFGLTNVTVVEKALWNEETVLRFFSEGADGGRVATATDQSNIIEIPTTRLRKYLNRVVDLLKIDIEGAELTVLEDCKDLLHHVKHLFVEYHSFAGQPQQLAKLIQLLEEAGFRLYISTPGIVSEKPFVDPVVYAGMDGQLNIHAVRR